MRRFIKIIIVLIILGFGIYFFRAQIQANVLPQIGKTISRIHLAFYPCSEPINYSIGTFSSEFGISQKYFLSALADAEAIWEKPFGKQLFTYEPKDGDLKINLIYDYRQQATTKLESLGIVVKENRASYDALKAKYVGLKTEYNRIKLEYDTLRKTFDDKQISYQKQVEYWNAKGGAPRAEYSKLQAQKAELQGELVQLNALQAQANELVSQINALVTVINRLANDLNITVDKYNTIGASRGESFEEGLYTRDSSGEKIDIYEFSDRAKLVRVLAHELGHGIGLEHVSDPKAIMYEYNQGESQVLTKADITALNLKCGVK